MSEPTLDEYCAAADEWNKVPVEPKRLCKDCRHFRSRTEPSGKCSEPRIMWIDPVYGQLQHRPGVTVLAVEQRNSGRSDRCGMEAKWFMPKDEQT